MIITMGKNGAIFASDKEPKVTHVLSPVDVKVVDTTVSYFFCRIISIFISIINLQGAGDAFTGALAHYLATEPDLPLVQKVGAACMIASMSVTAKGTQKSYPNLEGLKDFDIKTKVFDWTHLD